MNEHYMSNPFCGQKQKWVSPSIEELEIDIIKQEEDEILLRVLSNEENFRILTGSV